MSIGVAPEWADIARQAIVNGVGEYVTGGSVVAALLVAGKFALNGIVEARKDKAVVNGKRIPLDTREKKAAVRHGAGADQPCGVTPQHLLARPVASQAPRLSRSRNQKDAQ